MAAGGGRRVTEQINNSVFKPLQAVLTLEENPFSFVPLVVAVRRISLRAGADVGTAVVDYPATYASNPVAAIGKRASIKIGETMVFRGAIASAPLEVGVDRDEFQIILSCDKWIMKRNIIGQAAIGSTVGGFNDVGYDVVFNKDGQPNKDPDADVLDFCLGSSAAYWTAEDMLRFVFANYIDEDVAVISDDTTLPEEFLVTPSHVNLVGQTALQAIDTICQIAGVSWGLIPDDEASVFVVVKPQTGTAKTVRLFQPKFEAGVSSAGTQHATGGRVEKTMLSSHDYFQAISGCMVIESTFTNQGDSPLLTRAIGFVDKKFVARFKVDVTAYQANSLGQSLSAGAKPKPWLGSLVTRIKDDGSAYITAEEMDADPELRHAKRVDGPVVWLSQDSDIDNARLVTGGLRVDLENCTIDFEKKIQLARSVATDSSKPDDVVSIDSYGSIYLWVTAAVVTELVEYDEQSAPSSYLPLAHHQVIRKDDLVPEHRINSLLPDLATQTNRNAKELFAEEEEAYVDVTDQLAAIASAALVASSILECRLELAFLTFPLFNIGDWVTVQGRDIGLTGKEVVVGIEYDVVENYQTTIQCTNVIAGVAAGKYLEADL